MVKSFDRQPTRVGGSAGPPDSFHIPISYWLVTEHKMQHSKQHPQHKQQPQYTKPSSMCFPSLYSVASSSLHKSTIAAFKVQHQNMARGISATTATRKMWHPDEGKQCDLSRENRVNFNTENSFNANFILTSLAFFSTLCHSCRNEKPQSVFAEKREMEWRLCVCASSSIHVNSRIEQCEWVCWGRKRIGSWIACVCALCHIWRRVG